MIRNCAKCSRAFVFFDGQESEWHEGWLCIYCAPVIMPLDHEAKIIASVTEALRSSVNAMLSRIVEVGAKVSEKYPPEKAEAYSAGFHAAIAAVGAAFGNDAVPANRNYLWSVARPHPEVYEYAAMLCVAATEADARLIHPSADANSAWDGRKWGKEGEFTWPCKPDELIVRRIGVADPSIAPGTVLMAHTVSN